MSVSSRIQRIAIGTVTAAAILGVVFLTLPYLVSEQQIRAAASRSILAATGIVPRIDGHARLALLPRPAIQIQEIYLDDGSKSGPAVGALQASLQFWPLLFGEIKVATLTLDRLRLAIDLSPEGKLIGGLPINPAITGDDDDVPELRVANGSVLLRVQGRDRVEIISRVDASLNWSGASLTATGSFVVGNKPANGTLVIADTAALAKGQRSSVRFRVEADPVRIAYEGGITFRESSLQGEGAFSADGRSLREALALFGISVPSPTGFERFSAKATVSLTPIALSFTKLALELDGNRADGGLTWKRDGNRSILQGTLASETTDLSIYQSPFRLTANGRDWNRNSLDTSALQNFDLDLRLSCGKLIIGKIEIGKTAIALGVRNRQFTAAIGEAQFYGGTLRGNAIWNAAEESPSLRFDANLGNFDLERGLGGLTGFRRLEGKGSLTIAVTSKGKSAQEIAAALSGKIQLAMKQGALAGINAEAVLRRLERRPLSGTGDLRGGRTLFERLIGNLEIENGIAKLTGFEVESPILKISLQGDTSITQREFDLRGVASLIRAAQGTTSQIAFDLPFLIYGTWDNPYLLPDPDALIRHSGATAPLLDAVRGRAAREAMRSVIETVTGLRSIGELPVNPTFEPPAENSPSIAPSYAPSPQPTQSR